MESQQQNINIVPRMKTIKAAYQQLKLDDPETCVSKNFIRQLVINKKIKSVLIGNNKRIFSYDDLLNYLKAQHFEKSNDDQDCYGKLRSVKSR